MEFHRDTGEGGAQQRWIDENLPTCPMCRVQSLWGTSKQVDQQALVRWYFRCSSCGTVFSTIPDAPAAALAEPVLVAKTPLEVNLRVEAVGRRQDEDFLGEEFPLSELKEWAEEREE